MPFLLATWVSCAYAPPPSPPASPRPGRSPEKVRVISVGAPFSKEEYLVPGYVTILELYADW